MSDQKADDSTSYTFIRCARCGRLIMDGVDWWVTLSTGERWCWLCWQRSVSEGE